MVLHRFHSNNVTIIQNRFIDEFMVSANGEYVKVYLYLLRHSSSDSDDLDFSLSSIADALDHTEKDIKRALAYWEKLHLLYLSYDQDGSLTDISFTEPSPMEERSQQRVAQYAAGITSQDAAAKEVGREHEEVPSQISISADRKKELSGNEEVIQLIYVAEQYLGKQLSKTDVDHLLFFYDELHLSTDVIEYLIEYCVSKGIKSIHYIKKVAFEWAQKGVKTVQDAKSDSNAYHKEYYTILKAFGIHNRGPAEAEITFMENWINVLGFSMDIIIEAINRTITRIHNPSFPYTDSILQDWNKKGVHRLADITDLEKSTELPSRKRTTTKKASNDFGFTPRDYDFKQLEEQLLDY